MESERNYICKNIRNSTFRNNSIVNKKVQNFVSVFHMTNIGRTIKRQTNYCCQHFLKTIIETINDTKSNTKKKKKLRH